MHNSPGRINNFLLSFPEIFSHVTDATRIWGLAIVIFRKSRFFATRSIKTNSAGLWDAIWSWYLAHEEFILLILQFFRVRVANQSKNLHNNCTFPCMCQRNLSINSDQLHVLCISDKRQICYLSQTEIFFKLSARWLILWAHSFCLLIAFESRQKRQCMLLHLE